MDLTTTDHLLTTTRSVRKRLDLARPVEREVIERSLEIALQAPTGSDQQRWQFVVLTEPAMKQGIAELYRRSYYTAYAPKDPRKQRAQNVHPGISRLSGRPLSRGAGAGAVLLRGAG